MNDEKNEKPPNTCDEGEDSNAFARFENLARRLLAVKKEELTQDEIDSPDLDEELATAET